MDVRDRMDKVVNLAKRRGFVFPSGELYGGLGGFWDFGPLGIELKNNLKRAWWTRFVQQRDDVVGLDSTIITNPTVWEASGHVKNFQDVLIECKHCHGRFRAEDVLPEAIDKRIQTRFRENAEALERHPDRAEEIRVETLQFIDREIVPEINKHVLCSRCNERDWTRPEHFNSMLSTNVGPVTSRANVAYLRPETAQGIFVDFDLVRQTQRMRLPFGIAQIGKAFRNEITPGNFIFRSREFEQMEIEYFVEPGTDDRWFDEWVDAAFAFFTDLGLSARRLRRRRQGLDELAHYAKATTDLEYEFGFDAGWAELIGVSNRRDYDLTQHGKAAKGDPNAFAIDGKVPYVIEPSFGVERPVLAFLLDAIEVVQGGRTKTTEATKEEELVLRLHRSLAPYKAAVLPLSKKPELQEVAGALAARLRQDWMVDYDETASIGRRYRRQDEIGTPYCLTVDFDTLEDKAVTIRDRDTMAQERVAIADVPAALAERLA